jgi:hypothetical protein
MSAKGVHNAHSKPNDIIYTPKPLAERIIQMTAIQPHEVVLDPCRGGGVFYDNLPPCHKYYCEIAEGKDFYGWHMPVDVVIGNPPYSQWTKWLAHTLTICKKRFCYVFGANSLTGNRIQMIHDAGFGITKIHLCKVAWWMTQSLIIVAEKGASSIMTSEPIINCEHCGTMCGRGIFGNPPNECNKEKKDLAKKLLKEMKKVNDEKKLYTK